MKLCLSMCVFVCVRARYRRLIVFEMFNTLRRFYCGILRGPHVALNCVWLFFFFGSIKTSGWVGVHLFSGMFFSVHRWEQYISTHALFSSSPALKKVIKKEPCTLSHMVKWKSVNSRRLSIFNTDFNLLHNQKIFIYFCTVLLLWFCVWKDSHNFRQLSSLTACLCLFLWCTNRKISYWSSC